MQKLRKIIVVSVMMATVFSMSMVVAPVSEAAASSGDLIKMAGLTSVYYLGQDGKRYPFPNEKTYFSWYSDWSGVKTISQSELESYSLASKNIVVRPGTSLVKITTDPKVYAVEANGVLRSIVSEANAINMWGANWAKRVIDVPDGFFTNYTVGSPLNVNDYPGGSLVKMADDPDVFYISDDGEAQVFSSEAAFVANNFDFKWVVTAPNSYILPPAGDEITGRIDALVDTSQGGGSGTGLQPGAGTGLSAALSGDTAPSTSLPSGAALVSYITVNLTAANDGAVTVSDMTFTRFGTGLTSDFDGGYLFVGNEAISNKKNVSSDHTITFNGLGLVIAAGTTKAVTLKMNADPAVSGNHGFKLASASAVITNGATVSGSFPISGNIMSYSNTVTAGSLVLYGAGTIEDRMVGETEVLLGEIDVENTGTEDVKLNSIRVKQNGDADDGDLANLYLSIDDEVVVDGVSVINDYAYFELDTPYLLEEGNTYTLYIYGDIVSGVTKTVEFVVRYDSDVDARGTAYGTAYSATIDKTLADSSIDVDTYTIKGAEITVSFDGPAADEVKAETDNVILANFKAKVDRDDVEFDGLEVVLDLKTGGDDPLENFEMYDSINNVTYTPDNDPNGNDGQVLTFSNVILSEDTQYNFQIRADVPEGANTGQTYKVSIDFADAIANGVKYTGEDKDVIIGDFSTATLTGKIMTVAMPGISFDMVGTTNATYVENASKVLLMKAKVTANGVDDLKVSRVKVDGDLAAGLTAIDQAFTKFYLNRVNADGSETTLDTETSMTGTDVSFSGFTLNVPAGLSNGIVLVVRGDVKDNPTTGTIQLTWNATTDNYTVKDSDNNAVAIVPSAALSQITTIADKGEYTMAIDTNDASVNTDKNVLGGTRALLGRIKLTAQKEAAILEDLTIESSVDDDTLATLHLFSSKTITGTPIASADLNASSTANFEDMNIEIPVTGSTYLYIAGDIKPIDYSNSPSADATGEAEQAIELEIANDGGDMAAKAMGKATGEELDDPAYTGTDTNTSTVMGGIMSAFISDFAGGTLGNGNKKVFTFKVTAPASSNVGFDGDPLPIYLDEVIFSTAGASTSAADGTVVLSNFQVERIGGSLGKQNAEETGGGATTLAVDGTFEVSFDDTYATSSADLLIKPGTTAEFAVWATVSDYVVDKDGSLQVFIDDLENNAGFRHFMNPGWGSTGVQYPLLSGVTDVGYDNPGLD